MGKVFLLLLGIAIVWWICAGYRRKAARNGAPPSAAPPEDMVRCAHCGVHLPRSESLLSGERHYCGEEHRRAREAGRP